MKLDWFRLIFFIIIIIILVFALIKVLGKKYLYANIFNKDVSKKDNLFNESKDEEIIKKNCDGVNTSFEYNNSANELKQNSVEKSKDEKVVEIPEKKSPLKFPDEPDNIEIRPDGTFRAVITPTPDMYARVLERFKNAAMVPIPESNEKSQSSKLNEESQTSKLNEELQSSKLNEESQTPLESFNVFLENNVKIFDNTSINIFLIFFFIIFYLFILNNNLSIKKNVMLILCVKGIFDFFFNNFKNLVSNIRFERYFFLLSSVFLYIIFENIGGLYLLELSYNSHAIITLFLSFFLFFNYFINFVINFNEYVYIKFLQKNINVFFAIFLFLIEVISFLIRPFSLGIRLFANILSGHILIHIFFNVLIFTFKFFFWYSFLIFIFCLFIMGMEIFVGFIQAYIFFILNLIYLKDISRLH